MIVQKSAQDVSKKGKLFKTSATNLFDVFLSRIPACSRQKYVCSACRSFFDRYADIVAIRGGKSVPLFWSVEPNDVPKFFKESYEAVRDEVKRARVTSVFVTNVQLLGTPVTGKWTHVAASLPSDAVAKKHVLLTLNQQIAEKTTDKECLERSLVEYSLEDAKKALSLLESGNLYRSEKCIDVAKWFVRVHEDVKSNKKNRDNVIWEHASGAPPGFCHVKTTIVSTLLDDVKNGVEFEEMKRKFREKMDPLQYMRPSVGPSDGQIEAAEKIFKQLEASGSLRRKYARIDELTSIWTPPKKDETKSGGLFGHLKKSKTNDKKIDTSSTRTRITVSKFVRDVLPKAEKIQYDVPDKAMPYFGFVTAADLNSPPIIQWDSSEKRNPVSHYTYVSGSFPRTWSLVPYSRVEVLAIVESPAHWNGENSHHSKMITFVLDGCRNTMNPGLCLFPEILKNEFHSIRRTIESHSKSQRLTGDEDEQACGVTFDQQSDREIVVQVTTERTIETYVIDRWE